MGAYSRGGLNEGRGLKRRLIVNKKITSNEFPYSDIKSPFNDNALFKLLCPHFPGQLWRHHFFWLPRSFYHIFLLCPALINHFQIISCPVPVGRFFYDCEVMRRTSVIMYFSIPPFHTIYLSGAPLFLLLKFYL